MLIKAATVARGTFVICEYDASNESDDLNEISRKVLGKIPRTGAIRTYVYQGHSFNYLLEKDLIFLCIAAVSAGSELVFQFLGQLRRSFDVSSTRTPEKANLTRMLRDQIERYNDENATTKVRKMELELEDVTDIMRDNLGKVMERGEKIDSLLDKTNQLGSEAVSFRKAAKQYHDTLWWKDQKGQMMLGGCVAAIMVVSLYFLLY